MPAALFNFRRYVEVCEHFVHPSVRTEARGPMYAVLTPDGTGVLILSVRRTTLARDWYVAGTHVPQSWRIRISALHPRWSSTALSQEELRSMWLSYTGGV